MPQPNIPKDNQPMNDARTKLVSRPWRRFFEEIAAAFLVFGSASAGSLLLGRGDSGPGAWEEISLDPATLAMNGTILTVIGTPAGSDHVVASDGGIPTPQPLNDGAGNFIYVSYTP